MLAKTKGNIIKNQAPKKRPFSFFSEEGSFPKVILLSSVIKKLLKKIVKTRKTKTKRIEKTYFINKWKKFVQKSKRTDFKAKIFIQNITHLDSRLDRIKLK